MACVLHNHVLCLLLLSLVLGVASNADPCSVASPLHDAVRRTKSSHPSNGICDLRLNDTWVRVNTGSGSDLVTSCPASLAGCGTSFPVWLSGVIPHVSEGEVTRTACVMSTRSCCEQVLTVGVKNCGDFRVWRLPPTLACPQAYCFEDPIWMATSGFPTTSSKAPEIPTSAFPFFTRTPPNDEVQNRPNSDEHRDSSDHIDDDQPHAIDDDEDMEGWENMRRMRVMEIAVGVLSSLLVLSIVLNVVLVCVWKARSRINKVSKSQKYEVPSKIAPSCTKNPSLGAPNTPPPSYKVTMAADQPVVNSWVDKECLHSF